MKHYILLLRGINVGGKNALPMKELVSILEDLGAVEVGTYIQSGNVVFQAGKEAADRIASDLGRRVKRSRGFLPASLLLSQNDLRRAIERNPFPDAESDASRLQVGFLAEAPARPDMERLAALKLESERFHLDGKVFYLHAPKGVGTSKLAANSERLLGVAMTARNWRTVCRLMEMAGA
ncbi:hypothetical protein LMG31506_00794 [Cupriavidus yeoncheonensis]|uniref:DUF1697 domain-containing protein n=1 Tax=Cupriavidus yeoncheonensis TaxID=1462994 RepID=A0A916ITC5_9BURK|nr:DUF1697 domain-containing protein [Cupriavidus yeoncheonensis]CAG2130333.1 hypothetical protein LMG31506_00794 [Cupriavidus yeoncheonensis]